MKNNIVKYIAYIVIAIIGVSSCVTPGNYKYLSFFLDGVPDPTVKENAEGNFADSSIQIVNIENENIKPTVFKHVPFAENECNSCHDENIIGAYVEPQPALCYQCHDDMSNTYKTLHGPVQGGYCTSCHNAHKSNYPGLLVKNGQELCFTCHESSILNQGALHSDIGDKNCIDCHNPHGGVNKNYMVEGSCMSCHDNFKEKYKYVHGPVAAGYCSTCHDSHSSDKENLLLRTGQDLCTYCHDKNIVLQNETHNEIDDMSCMECHNAHGGEDNFILY